jgi:hypothetical protein
LVKILLREPVFQGAECIYLSNSHFLLKGDYDGRNHAKRAKSEKCPGENPWSHKKIIDKHNAHCIEAFLSIQLQEVYKTMYQKFTGFFYFSDWRISVPVD